MLVLSRKPNESIIITTAAGERIELLVVESRSDRVRLGFNAPTTVAIHRSEVQTQVDREKAAKAPAA